MRHRSVDRVFVEQLLQDESLSYREIAKRAQCSDFSVRSIAREVCRPATESAASAEPLTLRDWAIGAGVFGAFFGGLWLLSRLLPPMDGAM